MAVMARKARAASPVGARPGGVHSDDNNEASDQNDIHGGMITTAIVHHGQVVGNGYPA
jgi:hypothetical protein